MVLQSHTFFDTSLVLTIFDSTVVVALALYTIRTSKRLCQCDSFVRIVNAYVVSVAHIDVIVSVFVYFEV